jgi:hypothetical protein
MTELPTSTSPRRVIAPVRHNPAQKTAGAE